MDSNSYYSDSTSDDSINSQTSEHVEYLYYPKASFVHLTYRDAIPVFADTQGTLQDQKKLLKELGLILNLCKDHWMSNFQALKEYATEQQC